MESDLDLVRQSRPLPQEQSAIDDIDDIDDFDEADDFNELELAEYVQKLEATEGLDVEEALSMGLIDLDDIAPNVVQPEVEDEEITSLPESEFIEF